VAHWFRLILSVLSLAGLLAAGSTAAFAKSRHHCCPEMQAAMTLNAHSTHGDADDHGALPECCVMGACAVLAPVAPPVSSVKLRSLALSISPAIHDAGLSSVAVAPDLRPPIA